MLDEDISESEKLAALGVIDLEEAKVPMQDDQAPEVITKTTKHTLQHEAIVGRFLDFQNMTSNL